MSIPRTLLLDCFRNFFGWLDLYKATITMDNNVIVPSDMQTTAILENTTARKNHKRQFIMVTHILAGGGMG